MQFDMDENHEQKFCITQTFGCCILLGTTQVIGYQFLDMQGEVGNIL